MRTLFAVFLFGALLASVPAQAASLQDLEVEIDNPNSPGVHTVLITLPKELAKDAYAKWYTSQAYNVGLELVPVSNPSKKFGYQIQWGNEQASPTSPIEVYTVFEKTSYYNGQPIAPGRYRLGASLKKYTGTTAYLGGWEPVAYGESKEFELGTSVPTTLSLATGSSTQVRSLLRSMAVYAELFYDANENSYGKTSLGGTCKKKGTFTASTDTTPIVKEIKSLIGKYKMYCKTQTTDTASDYAMTVQTAKKEWSCIDSTGTFATSTRNLIKSKKDLTCSK